MNLTEASKYLGVSSLPLRKAVERGELTASHPLSEGPWIFNRQDLDSQSAQKVVESIKNRSKMPILRYYDQPTLF